MRSDSSQKIIEIFRHFELSSFTENCCLRVSYVDLTTKHLLGLILFSTIIYSKNIKNMKKSIIVNNTEYPVDIDGNMPLLWFLRDILQLTGTKYSCGTRLCGSCTVHIDGKARKSCTTKIRTVIGKSITTIEGLSEQGDHPLQKAWIKNKVSQCGYCQAGQIMNAASFLKENPSPDEQQIVEAMEGNICRCGTYQRIKEAISEAAVELRAGEVNND